MEQAGEGLARLEAELRAEKAAALGRIAAVLEGRITDANRFMVGLLGYPRDELVGKELWEIGLLRHEDVDRHYPLPEPLSI